MRLQAPAAFSLFAAGLVVSDVFHLFLPSKHNVPSITTSDAFAFALLLGWGVPIATVTVAMASVVSETLKRRGPLKVMFSAGGLALAMAAAGAVYQLVGGSWPFSARFLPAAAAAAVVSYLVNLLLMGVTASLAYRESLPAELLRSLRAETLLPTAMSFGMAPILLTVADFSLGLLPLMLMPLTAVYLALRDAAAT
jgi:hypothetical protein